MVKDYLNPHHGEKQYGAILHLNGYNIVFDNNNKDDEYQCLLNSDKGRIYEQSEESGFDKPS